VVIDDIGFATNSSGDVNMRHSLDFESDSSVDDASADLGINVDCTFIPQRPISNDCSHLQRFVKYLGDDDSEGSNE
jgi:hypothetical protein